MYHHTDQRNGTPPMPGSIWCNSCDSWFNPITNTCRCNNR
ncbi:hypothetical protein SAMN05216268_111288 [Streptomyces yunnanensis]|uniref:Uncharacterized protein n=1 Tax=Streptomyces yunnanensis TaxID=156453 RepID=A0A9X8N0G7_9ACTN|nr:hypothetical protein SAMN05216268_111288 [Streptomyces yunnanensis]